MIKTDSNEFLRLIMHKNVWYCSRAALTIWESLYRECAPNVIDTLTCLCPTNSIKALPYLRGEQSER